MQPTIRTCPVLLAISVITGDDTFELHSDLCTQDAFFPGVLHSCAGTPRTLGAAAAEDASQATDEDLSPSGLRDLHPELLRSPPRDRTWHCDRRFHRQIPAILKDESVGAIVLHAGVNDIRLRQTEVLKRDFSSLIETSRSRTAAGQRLQDAALHLTSYSSRV
ncbi:hypothetical protein Q8A67_000005 [Cirrhinus molitorella]|uniref:SGNH hydrolase-type esterase domain-containing protein n=1 Tax=Cirrhinus molitorella TaxID=172907 RepID=A0AA88NUN2_9TELE|nr:hypothetical protein Q8A67_000005 [Cirrhinus molitorella]